jgi:hypothetical protein
MIRKQIIGTVLTLIVLLGLFVLLAERSNSDNYYATPSGISAMEPVYYSIGVAVFFITLVIGAIFFRDNKCLYWTASWSVTSMLVGILALWTVALYFLTPKQSEWAGMAQFSIYYLAGCIFNQSAVLLAVLAFCTLKQVKKKLLSVVCWFCLIFNSAIVVLYIAVGVVLCIILDPITGILFGILPNTLPLGVAVPLILLILKEEKAPVIN